MKIVHVGWCREGNHDKVWGVILLSTGLLNRFGFYSNKYATFWGRRGGKLQTKIFEGSAYGVENMFDKKLSKGYKKINPDDLDRVYPEFREDLEKTAVWAILSA